MSLRRLLVLLRHLPPEGAVGHALTGGWLLHDELQALTVEVDHAILRATLAAGGVKKGRLPKPLRIPRPGEYDAALEVRRPARSPEELITFLDAMTGRRR